MTRLLSIILCLFASGAAPAPSEFVTGVWQSPARDFAAWKGRGVNYIFSDAPKPQNAIRADYLNDAHRAGLKLWISPGANLTSDDAHPAFAGWMQRDEPENWGARLKRPDGTWDMPATTALYVQKYRAAKAAAPSRPVFGNFNGMQLTATKDRPRPPDGDIIKADYLEFFKGADWLGGDWYVVETGRPPERIAELNGAMVDRLIEWGGGKPVFAFIGVSDQRVNPAGRVPTAVEVRAQIWSCIIHGARGIVYFPLRLGGSFAFDATTPEMQIAIGQFNAEIREVQDFILHGQRTRNGESALWQLSDGSTLTAELTFINGGWRTSIEARRVQPAFVPPPTMRVTFPQGTFDYKLAR